MTAKTVNNSVWEWKVCLLGVVSWCRHISPGALTGIQSARCQWFMFMRWTLGCAPSCRLQLPSADLQVAKGKLCFYVVRLKKSNKWKLSHKKQVCAFILFHFNNVDYSGIQGTFGCQMNILWVINWFWRMNIQTFFTLTFIKQWENIFAGLGSAEGHSVRIAPLLPSH